MSSLTMIDCPASVELERAFWNGDDTLRRHAHECDRCRIEWQEIMELATSTQELAQAGDSRAGELTRRDEIRDALASYSQGNARLPLAAFIMLPMTGAVAVALLWWLWPATPSAPLHMAESVETPQPWREPTVLAHGQAQYMRSGKEPDGVIRLVDGTLSVNIPQLDASHRVRVVAGDGEVTGSDAAFDVTAEADRLVAVRVVRGRVRVLSGGKTLGVVEGGHAWTAERTTEILQDASSHVEEPESDAVSDANARPIRTREVTSTSARSVAPSEVTPSSKEREPENSAAIESEPDPVAQPVYRRPGYQFFTNGWELLTNRQFARAADEFAHAEILANSDADREDALYWRGVALARAKRNNDAIDSFNRFLANYSTSPRAPETAVMLGWLLCERGQLDAARAMFRLGLRSTRTDLRNRAEQGLLMIDEATASE